MGKWRVVLSSEAARQLETIYLKHPDLRTDILARLKALEHFPPEKWFFIYRVRGLHLFRAETGQMIRLSGKASPETHLVQVTHAGLVRKPS
jgi:hypothetical protein